MARLTETQAALCDAITEDALARIKQVECRLETHLALLRNRSVSLRSKSWSASRAFLLVEEASDICDEAEKAIARECE